MQKKTARYEEAEENITVCANRFCPSDISQSVSQNSVTKWTQRHFLLAIQSYLLLLTLIFAVFPCYINANGIADTIVARSEIAAYVVAPNVQAASIAVQATESAASILAPNVQQPSTANQAAAAASNIAVSNLIPNRQVVSRAVQYSGSNPNSQASPTADERENQSSNSPKIIGLNLTHIDYSKYKYSLERRNVTDSIQTSTEKEDKPAISYSCNTRILSKLTRDIVSGFTGNNSLPHGYISRENGKVEYGPKAEEHKWGDLLNEYSSLNSLVMFILVLAIFVPLLGFIYYCCRRRGKCGAHTEKCTRKKDKILCICLSLLLLLLLFMIILPLFYAFQSNIYLQKGLSDMGEGKYGGVGAEEEASVSSQMQDKSMDMSSEHRIKNAQNYVNHVLVINYKEFYDGIQKRIEAAVHYITTEYQDKSALYIETVNLANEVLPKVIDSGTKTNNVGEKLASRLAEFIDALRAAKRAVIKALFSCNDSNCIATRSDQFLYTLDQTNFAYPLVEYLHKMELFISRVTSAHEIATNASKSNDQLTTSLLAGDKDFPPRVIAVINDVEAKLKEYAEEMNRALSNLEPDSASGSDTDESGESADGKGGKPKGIGVPSYIIFFGLAVCIILLMIILFMIVALLCGIFSKPRANTNSKLCNQSFAARLLILAVYLIFIFYALIALVLLIHLLLGTVAYRGICNTKGKDSRSIDSETEGDQNTPITENKLTICKSKENFYKTLRAKNEIRNVREINEYADKYDMGPEISKLTDYYNYSQYTAFFEPSTNLTYSRQQRLYLTIGLAFLNHRIQECIGKAHETYNTMFMPNPNNVRAKERPGFANFLKTSFSEKVYREMAVALGRLKKLDPTNHKELEEDWRAKQTKFDAIINNVQIVQKTTHVNELAKAFFDNTFNLEDLILYKMIKISNTAMNKLKAYCNEEFRLYLTRSVNLIENKIGLCPKQRSERSLSTLTATSTADSSSAAICYCVVDPMNAFWLSLLLCALLLLPILLLVPCLAYLLSKPCVEDIKKKIYKEQIPTDCKKTHGRSKPSLIIDCKGGGIRIGCVPSDYHSKCKCKEEKGKSKAKPCDIKHIEKTKSRHIECPEGGIITIDCVRSGRKNCCNTQRKNEIESKSCGRRQIECGSSIPIISIDCGTTDNENRLCGRRHVSIDNANRPSSGNRRHECSGRKNIVINCGPNDNNNRPSESRRHECSGSKNVAIDCGPNDKDNRPSDSRQHAYSASPNDNDNGPSGSRRHACSERKNVAIDCAPNDEDNRPSGSRGKTAPIDYGLNDNENSPSGSGQHASSGRKTAFINYEPNDNDKSPSGSGQHDSDCRRSEGKRSKRPSRGVISIDIKASESKQPKQDEVRSRQRHKRTVLQRAITALQPPEQGISRPSESCSTSVRSRRVPTENEPEQTSLNSPRAHNMAVVIKRIKQKNPKPKNPDKNS